MKDISNSELERRFLEEDWLTNDHFDKLVMNLPTKDEMHPDIVHHSTTKCKSSSEEKCLCLFPIVRRFANHRQLEQNIDFKKKNGVARSIEMVIVTILKAVRKRFITCSPLISTLTNSQ